MTSLSGMDATLGSVLKNMVPLWLPARSCILVWVCATGNKKNQKKQARMHPVQSHGMHVQTSPKHHCGPTG